MGLRLPGIRVPNLAAPVRGEDVEAFAQQARRTPILDGRLVTVTFDAASSAQARHALGRAYVGAIVVGVSAAHASLIAAATPAIAEAAGYDPKTHVHVLANGSYSGTVALWVF